MVADEEAMKAAKEAAEALVEYCSSRNHCGGCPFDRGPTCELGLPEEWNL